MKCPKCGEDLDTGLNCYKCGYLDTKKIELEPTTAEMLLDGAEKTGYIEAIRLVKNRKWSVTIGGYQGLSEKLSEAILIAYKEAIRNEEINDLAEQYSKEE